MHAIQGVACMQFIEFSMNIYLDGRLWRARARFVFLGEVVFLKFEKFGCCFWGKFPKKPVRRLRRRRLLV